MLLNLHLMRNGYLPIIILRAERLKYIRIIVNSRAENGIAHFANFVAKAVERSLDVYLDSLGKNPSEYLDLLGAAKISKNGYNQEYLSLLARTGKIGAVRFGRN